MSVDTRLMIFKRVFGVAVFSVGTLHNLLVELQSLAESMGSPTLIALIHFEHF